MPKATAASGASTTLPEQCMAFVTDELGSLTPKSASGEGRATLTGKDWLGTGCAKTQTPIACVETFCRNCPSRGLRLLRTWNLTPCCRIALVLKASTALPTSSATPSRSCGSPPAKNRRTTAPTPNQRARTLLPSRYHDEPKAASGTSGPPRSADSPTDARRF
jgi:hypothetical protein